MASGSVSTQPADRELIRRIRHGEKRAWAALLARYERVVYAIPRRFGLEEPHRSRVFNLACRTLLARIDELRDSRCIASWLVSATSRISRRSRRANPELTGTDAAGALTSEEVRDFRDRGMARAALDRVPSRCRTAVEAAFLAAPSLPWSEIARDLGLAEGHRCLSVLSQTLEEIGFEE